MKTDGSLHGSGDLAVHLPSGGGDCSHLDDPKKWGCAAAAAGALPRRLSWPRRLRAASLTTSDARAARCPPTSACSVGLSPAGDTYQTVNTLPNARQFDQGVGCRQLPDPGRCSPG